MYKLASAFTLLLLYSVISTSNLQAQTPTLISSAEITFEFVSKDVDGSIAEFTSNSSLDLDQIEKSSFEGSVAVSSLKTGNFLRDWSLKGKKYFDADNYPKITFKSTSISGTQQSFAVKGDLTIKGITKAITIDFHKKSGNLRGTTTLFSSDFNIPIKKEREDNKVNVTLLFALKDAQ